MSFRVPRILVGLGLVISVLQFPCLLGAGTGGGEFAYASLKNRLFQLERLLAVLSQKSEIPDSQRAAKADKIQAEIRQIKQSMQGKFDPADMALGEAVEAVRTHRTAWFLRYLSHGCYTGRKSEHHKPLEAVDVPGKNPNLAGRAALPLLGYPLMVILSYDPISREAYQEFIPQMESIVREMEQRGGKPYEFWDSKPSVIPNDLGWDVDRFWSFAQQCAGKVVMKYFWDGTPPEIRQATNLVSLVICTSFLNNVTIDLAGDKETQSKKAFWRANAAPWFSDDKSLFRNKFHVFHFFTHAWLTWLKLFNDTHFDKNHILSGSEVISPTRWMLKNAFLFSNISGVGYEMISTFAGTRHGFLETTPVHELSKPLKKVATFFHIKKVFFWESIRDVADNREGAWFGAALFLSNAPLKLSTIPEHRHIVEQWQASLKDKGSKVEPETGGPETGKSTIVAEDRVSLYDLNAPEGKKRIDSGFFSEVYRGTGAFEPSAHAAAELQAFRHLLGEDEMSFNLRQLYKAAVPVMGDLGKAYKAAKREHARIISSHFTADDGADSTAGQAAGRAGIFRDLFANEGQRAAGDSYNHEADYVYATRRADVAGCYGPVVLKIREKAARGLDLNKIADSYKYYGTARFLKNAIRLRWKTMLGDYILDKDEYLLPSFVPASEITGFLARSPKARVVKSHIDAADKDFSIALKAPPVLRRYEKSMIRGYIVIDVFDGEDGLIARLSESPDDTPGPANVKKSSQTLPDSVSAAWNEHMRNLRK